MKIKYMTKETLIKKLEHLKMSYPKTDERPAKGDESDSLYARHIAEELARRS
jgi:transposase